MDKNAMKKYAIWARRELIARVSQKAYQYGIRGNDIIDATADSIDGKILTDSEKKERQALIAEVKEKGFEQVMEEVAYTWFNRFSALRFMEVNGYLPTHVLVFTDEGNNFKPQIITEAIHMELDGLDMDKVYALKEADNNDELFKYLLITQCNALNEILPGMFQKIEDYTELLFPDNLLREGSVIEQMIALIPEDDWKDAVQIIGWLYQYYNSEPKDIVFANLKKKIKITKENIPAATQLFTPDWIVRYMVENSLGRLWLDGHSNDELKANWNYYLDEAEQEVDVQGQLDKMREEYRALQPEEILVVDPCMGSGHILVYVFDVLMQIYEAYGFNQRDAAKSIVENNIFGLDIDERAAQLAYFAVMMKARQYDRRFFSRKIQPHVYAICESNHLDPFIVEFFVNGDDKLKADMETLIDDLHDAKEYGSILNVTNVDFEAIYARFDEIKDEANIYAELVFDDLLPFVQVAQAMVHKYDVVITNPPYMGSGNMDKRLLTYAKKQYPKTSSDLSTIMMEKSQNMAKSYGYISMINIPVWMYLSSYIQFRRTLLTNSTMINLLYFGRGVFGSDFGTTAFVFQNCYCKNYIGTYKKLFEKKVDVEPLSIKEEKFFAKDGIYNNRQENFWKISGNPYAYNMTNQMRITFEEGEVIDKIASPRQGMATGNNDEFLRFWYEIQIDDFASGCTSVEEFHATKKMYAPYNKGGAYRKWYGNQDYVIKFNLKNYQRLSKVGNHLPSRQYYFHKSLTWSKVTMGGFSMRYMPNGFVFDVSGCSLFADESMIFQLLGFLNSKIASVYFGFLSPTVNYEVGNIKAMPFIRNKNSNIVFLVNQNMEISKIDWDSFETSWNFVKQPLICSCTTVKEAFRVWDNECNVRFNQLKANEEELNRIFIDIYNLQYELTPEVDDKDITVRKANLQRDIKGLISYAIGCMFGRYSLDADGLVYAGGEWDAYKYRNYPADTDNIIPICDDEYFSDDIVNRFVKFIETVYGAATLEENLKFIADSLGGKGSSRDVIRSYFMNDFYTDHCKMYQKRPIYWLFDSGKKNGFKALVYMHRYQPDTIARMRTDYVHEQQERFRTTITHLEERINNAPTSERVKLNKHLVTLKDQANEIRVYEEEIHHLADQMIHIDLDDGVKKNYEIFKDVLAKIK